MRQRHDEQNYRSDLGITSEYEFPKEVLKPSQQVNLNLGGHLDEWQGATPT